MPRENLTRFAWLSIAAAVCTIALKSGAYLVTGSVGLLSDAAESVVNLVAAFVALIALHVAAKPADAEHQFGHSKAEYFSAAVEGVMIFVAATFIIYSSVQRFLAPEPLEQVGLGLGISVVASALNGAVAFVLMRAGRKHRSITLTADGKHLLTDVWTSAGVVVGVLLVALTGWLRLDPIIAFLVGCNIIWTGWHLVRESVDGLMDAAPSPECQAKIQAVI
ncbi:MAG TPA: cation diffusion facilitator family transporter, partial [Dermatophilaceae bacterium]|nr:cation diffusion facilitator family transporter [Dermatophilaceae bacterium]